MYRISWPSGEVPSAVRQASPSRLSEPELTGRGPISLVLGIHHLMGPVKGPTSDLYVLDIFSATVLLAGA